MQYGSSLPSIFARYYLCHVCMLVFLILLSMLHECVAAARRV